MTKKKARALRKDAEVAAVKTVAEKSGLPEKSPRLVRPTAKSAQPDKSIGQLRKEWGLSPFGTKGKWGAHQSDA